MPNTFNAQVRKTLRFAGRAGRKMILQPREAFLIGRMAWWVTVLSVAARFLPLPQALGIVAGAGKKTPRANDLAVQDGLARTIDLLLSADVFWFKPICWKRAAVLHRYLLRSGIPTRIVFGVRNDSNGSVAGHAWLEAAGEAILESTPPEYVVTYSFPSKDRFDPRLATIPVE